MKKNLFTSLFIAILLLHFTLSANAGVATTTVTGVVWVDAIPLNGLRDITETKIPGVLIELHEATAAPEVVYSTAVSAPDGSFSLSAAAGTYYIKYIFPTDGFDYAAFRVGADNTINSAVDPATEQSENFTITTGSSNSNYGLGLVAKEDTRTFCDSKELTVTNWDKTFSLPKSILLSTKLTNVKLFTTAAVNHPTLGIENTNATPVTPTVEYKGRVTLTVPNTNGVNTTNWMTESLLSKSISLGGYDGVSDYGGTSGASYTNEFASAANTRTYTALAARNLFTGTDQITFPATTTSVSSIIGAANLQFVVSTYAAAGVCVVYTYQNGSLPVTLVSFSAKPVEAKTANLEWTTTAETNSDRFDIQKSHNGKQWSTIGSVKSQGESKTLAQYSFEDLHPSNGDNLYRLKMIDKDDTYAFSKITNVNFEGLPSLLNIYPNPAVSEIFVQKNGNEEVSKVQIFNVAGQLVKEQAGSIDRINISQFSNGIYSIQTTSATGSVNKNKILIAH